MDEDNLEVLRYAALGAHHIPMLVEYLFDLTATNTVLLVLDVVADLQLIERSLLVGYAVEQVT